MQEEKEYQNNIEFIPLSEAVKITGYSLTHLNLLSRNGRLRAKKIGRNWHTTKEWAMELIDEKNKMRELESDKRMILKNNDTSFIEAGMAAARIMAKFAEESRDEDDNEKINFETKINNEVKRNDIGNLKKEIIDEIGNRRYARKYIFATSIAVLVLGIALMGLNKKIDENKFSEIERFFSDNDLDSKIINENEKTGRVMGEEDNAEEMNIGSLQESENYVIDEVSFGAGVVLAGFDENKKLEITDVHSESFLDTKKNEVKMLVAWKTNKPAKTELSYSKSNGNEGRKIGEESYGYNHAAVITELEPRMSYVYKVKGNDKWGNKIESDYFGTFTTSKPISVFELITKALDELFGWAFKKQK